MKRTAIILIVVAAMAVGCSFLTPKPSLSVKTDGQPVDVKQTTGTVAIEVDRPKAILTGARNVEGNTTNLNFNFNSGWATYVIGGIFLLVAGTLFIKRRRETKQQSK